MKSREVEEEKIMGTLKREEYNECPQWLFEMIQESSEKEIGFAEEIREDDIPSQEEFARNDIALCLYTQLYAIYRGFGILPAAMKIALETLLRFPNEPEPYQNLGDAFWAMSWKNEAREIVSAGVEKFPEDEELRTFLRDIEDDIDNGPSTGGETLLLGLILLGLIIRRKFRLSTF